MTEKQRVRLSTGVWMSPREGSAGRQGGDTGGADTDRPKGGEGWEAE